MQCSISTLFAWAGPFPRASPWSSLQYPNWDEASTRIRHLESELHALWMQAWPGLQRISIRASTKDALGQSCPGWALLHEVCGWKWGTVQPGHGGLHHSPAAQHAPTDLGLLPDIFSSPSVRTYSPREGLGPVKVKDLFSVEAGLQPQLYSSEDAMLFCIDCCVKLFCHGQTAVLSCPIFIS